MKISFTHNISEKLNFTARLTFGIAIILIPLRLQIVLVSRPVPLIFTGYTDFSLFAVDGALLLMFGFWLISLLFSPRKLALGPRHIWIPLLGLTLAGWLSTMTSIDPLLSIYHAIRFAALFWFYVYIVNEIHSKIILIIPLGIQIIVQSIVGLAQFIHQHSVNLHSLGESFINPALPGTSVVVANGVRLLRAYGLTEHPNILGGCLTFGLLILLAAYLYGIQRLPLLAVFPLGLTTLLVTFSRSAWVAFLVGVVVIVAGAFTKRRWESLRHLPVLVLLSLFLLAPFLLLYSKFFGTRLNVDSSFTTPSAEEQAIGERLILVNSYLPIFLAHPWLGVGLGAAPLAMQVYYPAYSLGYQPPHVALFDVAVETGILGALSYFVLMASPLVEFFRHRDAILSSPAAMAVLALLLGITVVGFFDYYTWLSIPGRMWQWLAWGLWAVALAQSPFLLQFQKSIPAEGMG